MSQFPSRAEVEAIRARYPVGTRIEIDHMDDPYHPIAPDTKGTVKVVDDAGTIHCVFDNGRRLGVIPGEDSFHTVADEQSEGETLDESEDMDMSM